AGILAGTGHWRGCDHRRLDDSGLCNQTHRTGNPCSFCKENPAGWPRMEAPDRAGTEPRYFHRIRIGSMESTVGNRMYANGVRSDLFLFDGNGITHLWAHRHGTDPLAGRTFQLSDT